MHYLMGFRPNHHVFHGSNLSFDQFESFIFRKSCHPKSLTNFVDHRCPHLTIQTSFSSSYSQHTPSLMTGRTLTTFLHPAIPGTFPFGDAGTNWWKFSATKSAPSASWIQGIKSSSRMRRTEANTSHPSKARPRLGFFNKKLSCINFRSWKFLEQNSLSNKNSSSPCCEETTLKAWPRLQARNLCHLHLQRTGS